MKKILIAVFIFFVGLFFGLILAHGPLQAQNSVDDMDIMTKLNEIARGQEEVVAAVNALKEDIQIIKVRVTQLQ